jgi:hypothetical protein
MVPASTRAAWLGARLIDMAATWLLAAHAANEDDAFCCAGLEDFRRGDLEAKDQRRLYVIEESGEPHVLIDFNRALGQALGSVEKGGDRRCTASIDRRDRCLFAAVPPRDPLPGISVLDRKVTQ